MTALEPDTCTHCGRPVVWGTLQNRRRRSFDREPVPAAAVAPQDRYAYSRRAGAVVNLDGERRTPDRVLVPHRCAQYAAWREEQRIAAMAIDHDTLIAAVSGGQPRRPGGTDAA